MSNSSGNNPSDGYLVQNLTYSEGTAVLAVLFTTSSLSIIGSLWVMAWLVRLHALRHMSSRILFHLCVCCFFYALSFLITPTYWDQRFDVVFSGFCTFQGIMINFWGLNLFFWTTICAFNVLGIVLWKKASSRWEKYYHVSWVIAFVLSMIPLSGNYYFKSDSDYWCWIGPTSLALRFVCFWIPLDMCVIATVVMYIIIQIQMRSHAEESDKNVQEKPKYERIQRTLTAFPYPFVFLWFFPFVNRYYTISTHKESGALWILQVLTDPVLGFVLAIIFTSTGRRWKQIKRVFLKQIRPEDDISDENTTQEQFPAYEENDKKNVVELEEMRSEKHQNGFISNNEERSKTKSSKTENSENETNKSKEENGNGELVHVALDETSTDSSSSIEES